MSKKAEHSFYLLAIVAIVAVVAIIVMISVTTNPGFGSSLFHDQDIGDTDLSGFARSPPGVGKGPTFIPITSCGTTITTPGFYRLENDLVCDGNGITFNLGTQGYAYLDGQDHTIVGPGTTTHSGIILSSGGMEIDNLDISNFNSGILIKNSAAMGILGGYYHDNGYGVKVTNSGSLKISSGSFSLNYFGGVIFYSDGSFIIHGGTFSGNQIGVSGVYTGGVLIVKNGDFTENTYAGLSASGGSVTIEDGNFFENQYGIEISGNDVSINGGEFYDNILDAIVTHSNSFVVINDGTFLGERNALRVYNSDAIINGGTFLNSNQDSGFSSVYVFNTYNSDGVVRITDGRFSSLVLHGLEVYGGTLIIEGGIFSENGAGGISMNNGNLLVSDGIFENNVYGINFMGNGDLTVEAGTFEDNSIVDVSIASAGAVEITGGRLCSVITDQGGANIVANEGIEIDGSGAECRTIFPAEAYECQLTCDR